MFQRGQTYQTIGGLPVRILAVQDDEKPTHRVYGSDGYWRSGSPESAGQLLGPEAKPGNSLNLVRPALHPETA